MATHTCPRCEYEITDDEDYCEECQWHRDMQDFLDNANDRDHSELLCDILIDMFWAVDGYSNSHAISQERIDKVRRAVSVELGLWKVSKAAANA